MSQRGSPGGAGQGQEWEGFFSSPPAATDTLRQRVGQRDIQGHGAGELSQAGGRPNRPPRVGSSCGGMERDGLTWWTQPGSPVGAPGPVDARWVLPGQAGAPDVKFPLPGTLVSHRPRYVGRRGVGPGGHTPTDSIGWEGM